MALVYIEGVDRTGKSSLAGELVKQFKALHPHRDVQLIHCGPPARTAVEEYVTPLRGYLPWKHDIVFDRFHIGEAVWPKYFARESKMTPSERAVIEVFLHTRGAVGVLAERDPGGIRESFEKAAERGEPEPLDPTHIEAACADFDREFRRTLCPWLHYNHGVSFRGKVSQAESIVSAACTDRSARLSMSALDRVFPFHGD